jgi:transposase
MQATMIGLDLAKNVFQVHGVDAHERPVLRKRLSRTKVLEFFAQLPPCCVGMELARGRTGGRGSCSSSATTSS